MLVLTDKRPAVVVEIAVGLLVNGRAVLIDLEGEIEVGKREELGTAAERDGGVANDLSYRLLGGGVWAKAPMSNAVTAIRYAALFTMLPPGPSLRQTNR